MIYNSFEPGLFILEGLSPHDTDEAFAVIRSLILHKKWMDETGAQIPMTKEYLERVYSALNKIPIKQPPIESNLKEYVIAALAKMSIPPLPPIGAPEASLQPDIISSWISNEVKQIWIDCLSAAIFEKLTDNRIELSAATWSRENIPNVVILENPLIQEYLTTESPRWAIPVLASEQCWKEYLCALHGWPEGIDSTLIEGFARKSLNIPEDKLGCRRVIYFNAACQRRIFREEDSTIRQQIIEVIACRAYDCVKPEHHDENIENQVGVRRAYVRKMNPPVRLHYQLGENSITYTMYSNGDHDRGLS